MAVDAVDAIGGVPLLATLGRAELERIAARLGEHTFERGSVITAEGPGALGYSRSS